MLFKYCPQCGSMEFVSIPNGKMCRKCAFQGKISEGSMDEINILRKRGGNRPLSPVVPSPVEGVNSQSAKELAERLKALKGKSTENAEFL
ncbi:MAG: hypothetical protein V1776_02200 [Candidatus Diapherotrites archaeon]